jgi:hypothetical protein
VHKLSLILASLHQHLNAPFRLSTQYSFVNSISSTSELYVFLHGDAEVTFGYIRLVWIGLWGADRQTRLLYPCTLSQCSVTLHCQVLVASYNMHCSYTNIRLLKSNYRVGNIKKCHGRFPYIFPATMYLQLTCTCRLNL